MARSECHTTGIVMFTTNGIVNITACSIVIFATAPQISLHSFYSDMYPLLEGLGCMSGLSSPIKIEWVSSKRKFNVLSIEPYHHTLKSQELRNSSHKT